MKVLDKQEEQQFVDANTIIPGEVFTWKGKVLIMTDVSTDESVAIDLVTGEAYGLSDEKVVARPDAEVVLP